MSLPPLPINVTNFATIAQDRYAYIDKTPLIGQIARDKAHLFLVRPRRFGKTLLVSTLEHLFRGHVHHFRDTWLHERWNWAGETYPVVRLTMSIRGVHAADELKQELCRLLWNQAGDLAPRLFAGMYTYREGLQVFGATPAEYLQVWLQFWIRQHKESMAAGKTAARDPETEGSLVVLLDEYDIPINENLDQAEVRSIVDVMRSFHGVLKECADDIRFTFVTGIARFARTGLFSGANHLMDISDWEQYETLLGITEEELRSGLWRPHIEQAAHHVHISPDRLYQALAEHYNGYHFTPGAEAVYNPYSLLLCLRHLYAVRRPERFDPAVLPYYWSESGNTSLLQRIAALPGWPAEAGPSPRSPVPISEVSRVSYDTSRPDMLALLYQTGYLTYTLKSGLPPPNDVFLDFPNREIAETFHCGGRELVPTSMAQRRHLGIVSGIGQLDHAPAPGMGSRAHAGFMPSVQ